MTISSEKLWPPSQDFSYDMAMHVCQTPVDAVAIGVAGRRVNHGQIMTTGRLS